MLGSSFLAWNDSFFGFPHLLRAFIWLRVLAILQMISIRKGDVAFNQKNLFFRLTLLLLHPSFPLTLPLSFSHSLSLATFSQHLPACLSSIRCLIFYLHCSKKILNSILKFDWSAQLLNFSIFGNFDSEAFRFFETKALDGIFVFLFHQKYFLLVLSFFLVWARNRRSTSWLWWCIREQSHQRTKTSRMFGVSNELGNTLFHQYRIKHALARRAAGDRTRTQPKILALLYLWVPWSHALCLSPACRHVFQCEYLL